MQIVREARWEPLSALVGLGLAKLLGTSFASAASNVAWWVHNLVILVFLNFLPPSKHFHIITAIPNIFFSKLEPKGQLSKQDLENDRRFGTSHIDQFTWKQVLDMFSCTECGRCSSNCPATATKKPLAPRQLLLDLRDYLYQHQDEIIEKRSHRSATGMARNRSEVGENIVGPVIHDDMLWACNTCRACEEACPPMIEYVDKIVDMRRHLVQEEARFPKELTRTFKGMETQSNPWGLDAAQRFEWAERVERPDPRRQARRRVPLLRRLRRRLRRSQQEDHAGLRPRAAEGRRRLCLPRAARNFATAKRPAGSATSTSTRRWRRCWSKPSTATKFARSS